MEKRKVIHIGGTEYDLGINQQFSSAYDAIHFKDPTVYYTAEMKVLGNKNGEAVIEDQDKMSLTAAVLGQKYKTCKLTVPFTVAYVMDHMDEIDQIVERVAGQMTAINMKAQEGMTAAQKANARVINMDSMAVRKAKEIIQTKGLAWDGEHFTNVVRELTRDSGVSKVYAENSVSASSRIPITQETAEEGMRNGRKKVVEATSASGETLRAVRIMASAAGLKKVPIFAIKMKQDMEKEIARLAKYCDSLKDVKEYTDEKAMEILRGIPGALEIEPVTDRILDKFTDEEEAAISAKALSIYEEYVRLG